MISKGAPDEVLTLNEYSIQISICDLIDFINSHSQLVKVSAYSTEILLQFRRTDGIDNDYLNNISEERLREPLLATVLNDEEWIIDGNHRLINRANLNHPTTKLIYVPEEIVGSFTKPYSLWE